MSKDGCTSDDGLSCVCSRCIYEHDPHSCAEFRAESNAVTFSTTAMYDRDELQIILSSLEILDPDNDEDIQKRDELINKTISLLN